MRSPASRTWTKPRLRDSTSTAVLYFEPVAGLTGGSAEAFQLAQFTINGQTRLVRRMARTDGQTFTVNIGSEAVAARRVPARKTA